MMRLSLLFVVFWTALAANVRADEGNGHQLEIPVTSKLFGNRRTLRVLLPPGYHDAANDQKRYPVFYFTDGIAAMHGWGLADVATALWQSGDIPQIIFVAIDNGGATDTTENPARDRASEYLAYADQTWTDDPPEPEGQKFPLFLFDEVVPLINESFRTDDGMKIGLAGASYGAAVSLYTAMQHPDKIGWLLLESPSLHIGHGRMIGDARLLNEWPMRVYIGVGTAEGETLEAQLEMAENARLLSEIIQRQQDDRLGKVPDDQTAPETFFPANMTLVVKQGGTHWYDAWKQRLPRALVSILAPENLTNIGDH